MRPPSDDRVVTAAVGSLGDVGSCTSTACMAELETRYRVSPSFVIMYVFRGASVLCATNTGFALSRTSSTERRDDIVMYT